MTLRMLVLGVGLIAIAACATALQEKPDERFVPAETVAVEVVNDHWSEITVFLDRGGVRRRIGPVQGGRTKRFLIAAHLLEENGVRLRIEASDRSAGWSSEPVVAHAGQLMSFRIGPNVGESARVW